MDTHRVVFNSHEEAADAWLGGDSPWVRRIIGITTAPQVGSLYNEGIWDSDAAVWRGKDVVRTTESDHTQRTSFLLGTPALKAAGCSVEPVVVIARCRVVMCILHCCMAMGHDGLRGSPRQRSRDAHRGVGQHWRHVPSAAALPTSGHRAPPPPARVCTARATPTPEPPPSPPNSTQTQTQTRTPPPSGNPRAPPNQPPKKGRGSRGSPPARSRLATPQRTPPRGPPPTPRRSSSLSPAPRPRSPPNPLARLPREPRPPNPRLSPPSSYLLPGALPREKNLFSKTVFVRTPLEHRWNKLLERRQNKHSTTRAKHKEG